MPIYEFHCQKCERDSEVLVRTTDWKGTTCPHCGSARLSKKLSVFASSVSGGGIGQLCPGGEATAAACESMGSSGCSCCGGGKHHH